ncbi:hypothetical protein DVK85_09190 [Flavobacterium arcticum]|uniref:Uncharacterized protein n=1 Tax=Flavobacterium arcticum TaxID=1784713 RepID=A0A345HCT7_9FLAO|nr:hypothetical protein [Flavobacterium arcticum]AXG74397.1 hypothetical protein DVK85_09190 [Flavobacterium arcticum]KAF2512482.1 hypothetical protein E0W72_04475 [Flavobacterium arcticum]
MNFTTQTSYNNKLLLVDKLGKTKETLFNNISHFGDNYVLAKEDENIFYTLLDLNGNIVNESLDEKLNVIHRFDNGLLLTYSSFNKSYKSSDGFSYNVNYNVYAIYNHDTRKSSVVSIIQSDPLSSINNQKTLKVEVVKNFMNKTIYTFNDLIFSEMINEQYMIIGSHFDLAAKKSMKNYLNSLFETFQNKRMWDMINILDIPSYNGETSIDYALLSGRVFKEVEYTLYTLINFPDTMISDITFEKEKSQKLEKRESFTPVKSIRNSVWKKKNKWQTMFTGLVDFSFN